MSKIKAKEFWKQKFGEYPQTDCEKLAVAMMNEYKLFIESDPATPESTANWQKVGDQDKWLNEVRGRESGEEKIRIGLLDYLVNERKDKLPLEWSPVESEKKWQEEQFKILFPNIENDQPDWQRLNFFIEAALKYLEKNERKDNVGVWVKASERFPEKEGYYCLKISGGYMGGRLVDYGNFKRFESSAGSTIKREIIEWLNEYNLPVNDTQDALTSLNESQPQQKEVDEEILLHKLKSECKRIKIQRNNYEQELIHARRKISKLQSELEIITHK